jgi:hypothetical protein
MEMQGIILQQALAAATICKVLVDLVRQTTKCPTWILPILAILFGISSSLLMSAATISDITIAVVAQACIAGILAAGSAMGVTELQKRALQ